MVSFTVGYTMNRGKGELIGFILITLNKVTIFLVNLYTHINFDK